MNSYTIIKAKESLKLNRFSVDKGELCGIQDDIEPEREMVKAILNNEPVEWGGSFVDASKYELVYHGPEDSVPEHLLDN